MPWSSARPVLWSFPVAFAVHDLEELLTAGRWGATAPERIRERLPGVPVRVAEMARITTPQAAVAVGLVSAGVAGATVAGLRGRPEPFLAALAAYSLHALTHLAQSALLRGYTPGVATVPLVVVPYSVWAWGLLRRTGAVDPAQARRTALTGTVLLPPLLFGAQALARRLTR